MKFGIGKEWDNLTDVVPHAGTWIEIVLTLDQIGMAYDAGKIEFQRRL